MWGPIATVGPHRDRDFRYSRAKLRRLDHGLRAELKPSSPEVKPVINLLREASHTAVDVPNAGTEEEVEESRERRRAKQPVMPAHSPLFDLTPEPVAHHKLVALAPLGHEAGYFREIVAAVGITQDNELAS